MQSIPYSPFLFNSISSPFEAKGHQHGRLAKLDRQRISLRFKNTEGKGQINTEDLCEYELPSGSF
jgi:hypothetical protein